MKFVNNFIIALIFLTTCLPATAAHLAINIPWLIEQCRLDKTLANDGRFESGDGRYVRNKERDLGVVNFLDELEIIQVGLKHKPVALFSYNPNRPSAGIGKTRQSALDFAEANGAIVKNYIDTNYHVAVIVYLPEHEKAAAYFINNAKAANTSPADTLLVILEGVLFGYQPENIKNYLAELIKKSGHEKNMLDQMGLQEEHSEEDFKQAFDRLYDQAKQAYQSQLDKKSPL